MLKEINDTCVKYFKFHYMAIILLFCCSMMAYGGDSENNQGNAVAVDSSGNVYITGFYTGTVDFEPGAGIFNLTSVEDREIFVAKYTKEGVLVYAKGMDSTRGYCSGLGLVADASGNVFVTGFFRKTVDFDPDPNATYNLQGRYGEDTTFILKLDAVGNFVFAKMLLSSDGRDNVGNEIALDGSGNIYVAGRFKKEVDFDPDPNMTHLVESGSARDGYLLKLDADGNFAYVKQFSGAYMQNCRGLTIDASGNIIIAGAVYWGTVDLDPDPVSTFNITSIGRVDCFILKLNSSGNFVFAKQFGSFEDVYGYSVAVDSSGNIVTTGSFKGTVDFDPDPNSTYNLTSSKNNIFISKLNSTGDFVFAKTFSSDSVLVQRELEYPRTDLTV